MCVFAKILVKLFYLYKERTVRQFLKFSDTRIYENLFRCCWVVLWIHRKETTLTGYTIYRQGIYLACKYTNNWRIYLIKVNISIAITQFPLQVLINWVYARLLIIIFIQGISVVFNPLNAKLNSICHPLALLGAHHILHVSGLRVKYTNKWKDIIWNANLLQQGNIIDVFLARNVSGT